MKIRTGILILACLLPASGAMALTSGALNVTGLVVGAGCKLELQTTEGDSLGGALDLGVGTSEQWNNYHHPQVTKDFKLYFTGCQAALSTTVKFTGTAVDNSTWGTSSYIKNASSAGNANNNLALGLHLVASNGTTNLVPVNGSGRNWGLSTTGTTTIRARAYLMRRDNTIDEVGAFQGTVTVVADLH